MKKDLQRVSQIKSTTIAIFCGAFFVFSVSIFFAAPQASAGQTASSDTGEILSIPITRDTGISSVEKEVNANTGGARKIKLKGSQEYILWDIDPAALKGRLIRQATLHVCSASPQNAPLMRVGVSSVAGPWQEGSSFWYFPQTGSACFAQAAYKKQDWAFADSHLMDVVFGSGHTRWKFADAAAPDADGWQAVAVNPDIVAARVAGLGYGFCLWDEVGTTWSCDDQGFHRQLFPNRYVYSSEKKNRAPWLEVVVGGEDDLPPGPVQGLSYDNAGLKPGQVRVSWVTPEDRGGGKTLGFHAVYKAGDAFVPVPRYLVPMAGDAGERVVMVLRDMGLGAGQAAVIQVQPVDSAGNVGEARDLEIVTAPEGKIFDQADVPARLFAAQAEALTVGGLEIAVLDLLDKVDPVTGEMIPEQGPGYRNGNHLYSADERRIRLHGAGNETVFFQVNVAGAATGAEIRYAFDGHAGLVTRIHQCEYVAVDTPENGPARYLPDPVVPLTSGFSLPDQDSVVARQQNLSLICEVYIPHGAAPGMQQGKLTVRVGGDVLEIDVALEIWDFTLPDKLSFVPEMNAYGTVNPFEGYDYYRLAHRYRTCINRLPYNWKGITAFAPDIRADGTFDWTRWDRQVGPLLDGSAFADLPRANEPVDVFYLPFNENWPVNLYEHFTPSYWADEAFTAEYAQDLSKAFAAFAHHVNKQRWDQPVFQFYLNNKISYREHGHTSAAPWLFDEPVNTQDFWALRWYGLLWQDAVSKVDGPAKLWFRADISYPQFSRDLLWGVTDIEYYGGSTDQRTRFAENRELLHGPFYFAEYGSAKRIDAPNTDIVDWCMNAWFRGAFGVLPWNTIGTPESRQRAEQTALFYPGPDGPYPSMRLKAFTAAQQMVEYLTMAGVLYDMDRWALKQWYQELVEANGKADQAGENGENREKIGSVENRGSLVSRVTTLWQTRQFLGKMISDKAPAYRRSWVNLDTPGQGRQQRMPDIGHVPGGPDIRAAVPECAEYKP